MGLRSSRGGAEAVSFGFSDDRHRLGWQGCGDQLAAITLVRSELTDLETVKGPVGAHGVETLIHLEASQIPFSRADPAKGARGRREDRDRPRAGDEYDASRVGALWDRSRPGVGARADEGHARIGRGPTPQEGSMQLHLAADASRPPCRWGHNSRRGHVGSASRAPTRWTKPLSPRADCRPARGASPPSILLRPAPSPAQGPGVRSQETGPQVRLLKRLPRDRHTNRWRASRSSEGPPTIYRPGPPSSGRGDPL